MAGKILNFSKEYKERLENPSEKEFDERIIWNIHDTQKSPLKEILEYKRKWIVNPQYVRIKDKLYMPNKRLNLIFKIEYEKSERKEWLMGEISETTDIIYHYFRLDYLSFNKDKSIIGIVEKPYTINYL